MNCHEITERLDAWMDGELEGPEAASVERHVGDCATCATAVAEREALTAMLRETLVTPAEIAAEEGRFDGLWDRIAHEIAEPGTVPHTAPVLQPQPSPAPSLWRRLSDWWSGRFEQRQAWVPALAAAAVLVVMVALVADRVGEGGAGGPGDTPVEVAESPAGELPPFAAPRLAARDDEGSERLAEGAPAPRRRGAEGMVARVNEATVVSYEVDRGIVLIEQPEEQDQPMVVWHLMPEDVDGAEGDGESI